MERYNWGEEETSPEKESQPFQPSEKNPISYTNAPSDCGENHARNWMTSDAKLLGMELDVEGKPVEILITSKDEQGNSYTIQSFSLPAAPKIIAIYTVNLDGPTKTAT